MNLVKNESVGGKLHFDEVPPRKSSLTAGRLLWQIWFGQSSCQKITSEIWKTLLPPKFFLYFKLFSVHLVTAK
jgi:hypothetical protein